jgi:hypothetical protein
MAGVVRPRPAAPLGQAAYWERYSMTSEQKKKKEIELRKEAKDLDAEARTPSQHMLSRLLAREIRSLSSVHGTRHGGVDALPGAEKTSHGAPRPQAMESIFRQPSPDAKENIGVQLSDAVHVLKRTLCSDFT